MAKRVMLTCAGTSFALELARLFARAGDTVFASDSRKFSFARFSNSVAECFQAPSPRFKSVAYVERLCEIVEQRDIDVLIPTYEDLFYIAQRRHMFPSSCLLWIDSFEKLRALHDKCTFIETAKQLGFAVPRTVRLSSQAALENVCSNLYPAKLVFKPIFSRFAWRTVFWEKGARLPAVHPTETDPWVAQEYLEGEHLCTYGLAKEGRLLAHTAYLPQQQWGIGASIVFQHMNHLRALEWAQKFVRDIDFTGQIAFDFIEKDSLLYPIECNPRSTAGLHLFHNNPEIAARFKDATGPIAIPLERNRYAFTFALILKLFGSQTMRQRIETFQTLRTSTDVIWDSGDPWPAFALVLGLGEVMLQSVRLGLAPNEALTYETDYNGRNEEL
jgi:hypothetical protein